MIVEKLLGYELSHISSGSYHMLAVSTDGEVFAWGRGENGVLLLFFINYTNLVLRSIFFLW